VIYLGTAVGLRKTLNSRLLSTRLISISKKHKTFAFSCLCVNLIVLIILINSNLTFSVNQRLLPIYQRPKSKAKLQTLTTLVPSVQNETKKRAAITFVPGITNKLQGIFKRHNIDLVYSNRCKLSDVLRNPQNKCHPLEKSGVYQIACKGCQASSRQKDMYTLTRFKEHVRHIKYNHPDLYSVANHVLDHIHETKNEHTISIESYESTKVFSSKNSANPVKWR
jgi:hypothetical protein